MADLCTIDEVKSKGYIQGDLFDDIISDQIIEISEEIRYDVTGDANDTTLTSDNLNAKRACIYGVLKFMEKSKMISSTKNASSQREGNVAITFESGGSTSQTIYAPDLSYSDEFKRFMARLLPMPPVGSKSRCR